jgi:predicted aspartyl protease
MESLGKPVHPPIAIRALIDTGASGTCLDPWVFQQLNLPASGVAHVHTPTTSGVATAQNQYDVDILVMLGKHVERIETLPVLESHLTPLGIDGLLGRDILSHGILIFNGSAGQFTLSF